MAGAPETATREAHGGTRVPRRDWALYLGVLVLFAVAVLGASLAGGPELQPGHFTAAPVPEPEPLLTRTLTPPDLQDEPEDESVLLLVLGMALAAIVTVLCVIGVIWAVGRLIAHLRRRIPHARPGAVSDGESSDDEHMASAPDLPVMRRGIAAAQDLIASSADPGDAIVAAWVRLEQTASSSGAGRGASETPGEFTLRLLLQRPAIEDSARALLSAYESVRFGGRRADERLRAEAERALRAIEEGWR